MKVIKKLLLFLFIITISCTNNDDNNNNINTCIIKGSFRSNSIKLTESIVEFFNYKLQKVEALKKFEIDKNGNFKITLIIDSPILVKIFYQDVFITPKDNVSLYFSLNKSNTGVMKDSLNVTGLNADNYLYFNRLTKQNFRFPDFGSDEFSSDLLAYKKKVDSVYNEQEKFTELYLSKSSLTNEFKDYIKTYNDYFYLASLFDICVFKDQQQNLKDIPGEYLDVLKRYEFSKVSNIIPYNLSMDSYIRFLLAKDTSIFFSKKRLNALISSIKKSSLSQSNKDYLFFLYLRIYSTNETATMSKEFIPLLEELYDSILDPKYKSEAIKLINWKPRNSLIDTSVLKIKLVSINNELILFEDLLNDTTILYFDFWASWCSPCIEEYKYIENLRRYNSKCKFYSISIDQDKTKWKNSSDQVNNSLFNSYVLNNYDDISKLEKYLKVESIPRYLMIKNKTVIYFNAPRPSEKKRLESVFSSF